MPTHIEIERNGLMVCSLYQVCLCVSTESWLCASLRKVGFRCLRLFASYFLPIASPTITPIAPARAAFERNIVYLSESDEDLLAVVSFAWE